LRKARVSLHDSLEIGADLNPNLANLIRNISSAAREANKVIEGEPSSTSPRDPKFVDTTKTSSGVTNDFIVNQHHAITQSLENNEFTKPSDFWKKHLIAHVKMLTEDGIDNFKRTLGHNYINFLNRSPASIHFKSHLDLWKLHGSTDVFNFTAEPPGSMGLKADVEHFNSVEIADPSTWSVYTFLVSLMWEYAILVDEHKILPRLHEPLYGNPLKIRRGSRLIGQDLTHSVAEYSYIKEKTRLKDNPRVLEIGSGYGRLAHLFKYMGAKKYVLVDISPALIVAQNYMHNIMPNLKYFDFRDFSSFESVQQEFEDADVCFLSAGQIGLLPDKYFDLAINVCSLMEMKINTIDYYLKQIDRLTKDFFYTKQWTEQNNRVDRIRLTKNSYPIPGNWYKIADRVDPAFARLFEQVWKIR